ncbi:MAG TPA: LysR substrate-binding domain-containing protein [Nocardioides sp.]|uniref:LysR substrate-binding domain-containing protein n=1 Tax=Nocardioides sp. TaxID=35761 RepID=UPI002D7F20CA|nr:LysR substrate-binding domain-containing protein [Nocardioides sp.]HET6653307.1 LysR substrate-binding domain-containing protein [Nocardioides sp.]
MTPDPDRFAVTFVDGVTLDKWRRRWRERVPGTLLDLTLVTDARQVDAVRDGTAAMSFVRDLDEADRDGLHHIPLYREVPVVVVGKEHPVAAYDEIPLDDLRDELVLDDPELSTRLKVETVAAGTGVVVLPMSVARVHHRKDVVAVPVSGVPESQVGLAWRRDNEDPLTEMLIGIVRGRTERSSRGDQPPVEDPPPKRPGAGANADRARSDRRRTPGRRSGGRRRRG